ncbi:MAG: ABC transporter permease [Devosia sp.]|nr:ABC transporter permease [Devosia sp.]
MILAMLRVMLLGLLRDRGALAMAFVLPPTIFVIFAAIFSGTSGDGLRLKLAYGITASSDNAARLETELRAEPSLRVTPGIATTEAEVRAAVADGSADVGLVVRGDLVGEADSSPILVLVDPGKLMAGPIVAGHVQRILATRLLDLGLARSAPQIEALVGAFTPEQAARLAAALDELAEAPPEPDGTGGLVSTETLGGGGEAGATVTYYAGAVAILFLLFSAMQGAATLIEERTSGIVDRLAVGPAGTDVVVAGKFLFLTLQGIVQVALIFLVAVVVYGVDLAGQLPAWTATTVLAAAAAAGLGLAIASACTSKQQAQTITTFVVLVSSAIGGSMVPRFLMPPWLQEIGWYTPNAWAIEAYHGVLWRGEGIEAIIGDLLPLGGLAIAGVVAALIVSRWRLKL